MSPTDAEIAEADRQFAAWMRENLHRVAECFGVTVSGVPVLGWRLLSISAPVSGDRWLRVTTEALEWAHGRWWTGSVDANAITEVRKPVVLDRTEWEVAGVRRQRAELMTRVAGRPCSAGGALRGELDVSATWWTELRDVLDTLGAVRTDRVHRTQEHLDTRTMAVLGRTIPVRYWETVHGDLHWGNVFDPLALVDWDHWGTGPVGTDAATLYCYSLLAPRTAETVWHTFADTLDTPTGTTALLHTAARLLHRISTGDHPELAPPLHELVERLARR
ncbi:phosphotransferase [Actinopolyspora saharensis]|uniref:phosphotransferase n=1 Tax=Actinopolyspora saharensis TaxID=995062 RepID=UPI003F66CB29